MSTPVAGRAQSTMDDTSPGLYGVREEFFKRTRKRMEMHTEQAKAIV